MRRNKFSPIVFLIMIVAVIAGIVIGILVRKLVPDSMRSFRDLFFWLIVIGCGALGALIGGKVSRRR